MIEGGLKERLKRWSRFLLGGGLNTGITYALYLLLNIKLEYQVAYAIAYVTGIVFRYVFNALIVFNEPLSIKGLLSFPVVYAVQYLLSALILGSLVEFGIAGETIAPLIAIALTIPVTYVLAKRVIQKPIGSDAGKNGRNR